MINFANLYVIAAPSGTGKTTLVKDLVDAVPHLAVSISYTTRPKRTLESHTKNYHFIDASEFKRMIKEGDFLEYATIYDHLYGTSRRVVEETLAQGIDVILEIDWQGHQQIKELFPDAISIFILPPSLEILKERLIKRQQDHPEVIAKRLQDVVETVAHIHEFDYVVVNDDFTTALNDLRVIIEAGRLLEKRQTKKNSLLVKALSHPVV